MTIATTAFRADEHMDFGTDGPPSDFQREVATYTVAAAQHLAELALDYLSRYPGGTPFIDLPFTDEEIDEWNANTDLLVRLMVFAKTVGIEVRTHDMDPIEQWTRPDN